MQHVFITHFPFSIVIVNYGDSAYMILANLEMYLAILWLTLNTNFIMTDYTHVK